jgi:hypothetical protein
MNYAVPVQDGKVLPGVQVTAQYGLFSNDHAAQRLPSGQMQLLFQDKPAWIVTFAGPGVVIPSSGPGPQRPDTTGSGSTGTVVPSERPVHNEQNIVIDAATGEFVEDYS